MGVSVCVWVGGLVVWWEGGEWERCVCAYASGVALWCECEVKVYVRVCMCMCVCVLCVCEAPLQACSRPTQCSRSGRRGWPYGVSGKGRCVRACVQCRLGYLVHYMHLCVSV